MNYHMKQKCTNDIIPYLWRNDNNKNNQVLCHNDAGCNVLTKFKHESTNMSLKTHVKYIGPITHVRLSTFQQIYWIMHQSFNQCCMPGPLLMPINQFLVEAMTTCTVCAWVAIHLVCFQ